MFLHQLNFPNPIKTPILFSIKNFCIGISCSLCIDFASSYPPAPQKIGTARTQQQQDSKNYNCHPMSMDLSLMLFFGGVLLTLFGTFFFLAYCSGCCPHPDSLLASWVCPLWLFLLNLLYFHFLSPSLVSWHFLSYPYIFFSFSSLSSWIGTLYLNFACSGNSQ